MMHATHSFQNSQACPDQVQLTPRTMSAFPPNNPYTLRQRHSRSPNLFTATFGTAQVLLDPGLHPVPQPGSR